MPGMDEVDVVGCPLSKNDVDAWLDTMEELTRTGDLSHLAQVSRVGNFRLRMCKMESLVLLVRASGMLRPDRALNHMFGAVGTCLGLPHGWLAKDAHVPSPATICRYRFVLDQSYNSLVRLRFQDWIDSGVEFHIRALWDSSPRGGREWLLGELCVVKDDDLEGFVEAIEELAELR